LGSKQTKLVGANEKNPNWPLKEYAHFTRLITMKYYAYKSIKMLEHEFLDTRMDGSVELCKDLCCKFICKFVASKKFNNYLDYRDHVKWLNNIVTTHTTNVVMGIFEVLYRKKKDEEYDKSNKDLLAKLGALKLIGTTKDVTSVFFHRIFIITIRKI
jgi:hypothetical protein